MLVRITWIIVYLWPIGARLSLYCLIQNHASQFMVTTKGSWMGRAHFIRISQGIKKCPLKKLENSTTYNFSDVKTGRSSRKPRLDYIFWLSQNAYGAVAYARWNIEPGKFESRVMLSKNWIAPMKTINIIRLKICWNCHIVRYTVS